MTVTDTVLCKADLWCQGVGDEMNSRGSRSRSSEAAGPRPRAVTQDFLGGFRSHVG